MTRLLSLALGGLLATTTLAAAQDYPSKPITMLIGFGAGGTTDTQGRSLAAALEAELGQPINVVNRPGAGGSVAAAQVAAADPDGYTILFGGGRALTFNPLTAPVGYTLDDFDFIGAVAISQPGMVVRTESPFQSMDDVLAAAAKGPVSYATQTTLDRLTIRALEAEKGVTFDVVPTQGGSGMVPLLLAGEVDFAWSGGIHAQYTEAGDMRLIAAMTSERQDAYPDVPTFEEATGLDIPMEDYRNIAVPDGTSADVMTTLQTALEAAAQNEAFVKLTEETLLFPVRWIPGADLTGILETERDNFGPLVETFGEAN